jgi:hypothetical protein
MLNVVMLSKLGPFKTTLHALASLSSMVVLEIIKFVSHGPYNPRQVGGGCTRGA